MHLLCNAKLLHPIQDFESVLVGWYIIL